MGRPDVEEITAFVEYTAEGKPRSIRYVDQEGCGHEGPKMALTDPIGHLVQYHLDHAARSHKIYPKIMCGYTVTLDDGADQLECKLEKHGGKTRHQFEM